MTYEQNEATPPWAELLHAALGAAYRTMTLEGEERLRAFDAEQWISDTRMDAGGPSAAHEQAGTATTRTSVCR
jgi:hypothetical protein